MRKTKPRKTSNVKRGKGTLAKPRKTTRKKAAAKPIARKGKPRANRFGGVTSGL